MLTAHRQYKLLGTYRLILALMVAFGHIATGAGPQDLAKIVTPMAPGFVAVLLFFVVSGYVIAEATDVFYQGRPKAFIQNRFYRIYPPFLFALVLSILIHTILVLFDFPIKDNPSWTRLAQVYNPIKIFYNIVSLLDYHVANATERYYVFVRYIWAVVVEIQFYAIMALAIYVARAKGRRGLILTFALCAGLSFLPSFGVKGAGLYRIIEHLPFFLLGVSVYFIQKKPTLLFLLGGAVSLLAVSLAFARHMSLLSLDVTSSLFYGLLIVFLILARLPPPSPRVRKIDALFGDLTYPLYLNHYIFEVVGFSVLGQNWGGFSLAFAGSFVATYVAMKVVEPMTSSIRIKIRGRALA